MVGIDLDVYLTETGYSTNAGLSRETIAGYTVGAYDLVWLGDPIVMGVMPFELSDPGWEPFNWIEWGGAPYPVYDAVQARRSELGYED